MNRLRRSELTVLLPAHNEETRLPACVDSLLTQTRPPDRIVVLADNCTDGTARVAVNLGADVFVPQDNRLAKAGAINQWLDAHLDGLARDHMMMVVDADGVLDCDFIENAIGWMRRGYAAVGGVFRAEETGTFVGFCQANEYERYRYLLRRSRGKTLVLTGTAALFTAGLLREVVQCRRRGLIPASGAGRQHVYSHRTLTEDLELTLAIKSLGHSVVAPIECSLTTEAMPTWAALTRQRYRWKFGALETAWLYRRFFHALVFHRLQVWNLLGIFATTVYLGTLVWALWTSNFHLFPIWIAVTVFYMFERAITVAARGWRAAAVGFAVLPEMVFDLVLQWTQLRALAAWLFGGRRVDWYGSEVVR